MVLIFLIIDFSVDSYVDSSMFDGLFIMFLW